MRVEHPLHACQECCDPVPPHSTSPLTFRRPDSVTIVNTCCKGIMTPVSFLSWQIYEARAHLAQHCHGCDCYQLYLPCYQPGILLRPSYFQQCSYHRSLSVTLWSCFQSVTQQTAAQRGNITGTGSCVLFSLFNWLWLLRKTDFEHCSQTDVWESLCQEFFADSRGNITIWPSEL